MKTTIYEYTCDECGEPISYEPRLCWVEYFKQNRHLCMTCMSRRLSHSYSICEDSVCQNCKGTGTVPIPDIDDGYTAEIACNNCNGEGFIQLYDQK